MRRRRSGLRRINHTPDEQHHPVESTDVGPAEKADEDAYMVDGRCHVSPDVHCLVVKSEDAAGVVQPRPLHLKTEEEEDGGWRPRRRRRRRRRRPRGRGNRWREGEGKWGLDDGTIMCEPDDRLAQ
jgi:hypothetical protein